MEKNINIKSNIDVYNINFYRCVYFLFIRINKKGPCLKNMAQPLLSIIWDRVLT